MAVVTVFSTTVTEAAEVKPQLVTVENHPYHPNDALREYLAQYGIVIEAWYPLGHGDASLREEPVFARLAEKYGKSPVQVILRWHIQKGNSIIPGSKSPAYLADTWTSSTSRWPTTRWPRSANPSFVYPRLSEILSTEQPDSNSNKRPSISSYCWRHVSSCYTRNIGKSSHSSSSVMSDSLFSIPSPRSSSDLKLSHSKARAGLW